MIRLGSSTFVIALIDASRNHGNCVKGTNRSRSPTKSQNPWTETFVTSGGEMLRPSVPDVIVMLLKDLQDLSQAPRREP